MLENQLLLAVVLKQHRILVKRAYFACEFDSADQVYRDRSLIFADRIKKRVLNVLCRLIVHVPISNFYNVELRYGKCSSSCSYCNVGLDAEKRVQILLLKVYTPSGVGAGPGRHWNSKPSGLDARWASKGCVEAVLTLRMWQTARKAQAAPR
jgi:hypothetical protein